MYEIYLPQTGTVSVRYGTGRYGTGRYGTGRYGTLCNIGLTLRHTLSLIFNKGYILIARISCLGVVHILRNQQRGRGFPNAYGWGGGGVGR